jgi:tetratricopeptide (TPR) repeat protein
VQGRGRFENRAGGRDERRDEREPIKRLPIPDEVTGQEIDPSVRQELMSLPKTLAEDVARNLVMVAQLLDEEPERAYAYSRVALRLASRVAAVREAAGFASYATERYAEALAEFRATRRMTGTVDLWPVMADCERGLGRPERALDMAGAPEVHKLDKAGQVEMRLVAAGARQDMGQAEAAVVTLQSSELASSAVHPWTARHRYAYADALLAVGREGEARDWFAKALEADHDGATDATERLAQLDGVAFVDVFDDDHDGGDSDSDGDAQAEADVPAVQEDGDSAHENEAADSADSAGSDDSADEEEDDSVDDGADDVAADDDLDEDEGDDDADEGDVTEEQATAKDDAEDAEDSEDHGDVDEETPDKAVRPDDDAKSESESDAVEVDGDLTDEADPSSFLDSPFRAPERTEREED